MESRPTTSTGTSKAATPEGSLPSPAPVVDRVEEASIRTSGSAASLAEQLGQRVLLRATVKQCLQLLTSTCRVKLKRCELPPTPAVPAAAQNIASSAAAPPSAEGPGISRTVTKLEEETESGTGRGSSEDDDDEIQIIPTPSPTTLGTKTIVVRKKRGKVNSEQNSSAFCTICKKTMSSKYGLKLHLRKHSGEKRFKCEQCGISFWSIGTFRNHWAARDRRNGICPRVNKTGLTGEWRPKGAWTCKICGKRMCKSNYVPHMKRHRGDKPFKCGVCGSSYVARSHLKYHMRVHSGVWQYSCIFCDRGFHFKYNLFDHLRGHTEERPFFCVVEHCGASFRKHVSLKRHRQMIHLKKC